MLLSTSLPLSESMPLSTSQRFLIPPFQRLRFTVLFMVATGLGWFLVGFVLQSLQQPPFTIVWQPQGLLGTFVNGLVAGLIVGATQWIVLRRYVPDWLWMLVTCAGYVMVMTTLQSWSGLIEVSTIASALSKLPPQATAIVLSILSIGLAAVCTIWLGWLQWVVLRQVARPCWGWVFVPAMAVLLSTGLVVSSELLLLLKSPLSLNSGVLAAGILGATQAIVLCGLRRRLNLSMQAIAPEILRYGQVRKIARQVRIRLHEAWMNEAIADRPVTYLVAADETGTIADYQPVDARAAEAAEQTPLPHLVKDYRSEDILLRPLARFHVTFMPSGSLSVQLWRGIPLLWLAISTLIAIVAAGAIVGYVETQLL